MAGEARDPAGPSVLWFRRDLRLHDHPALSEAVRRGTPLAPLFVLDPAILHGRFASPNRTWFLLGSLRALAAALRERGSRLTVRVGAAADIVPAFAREVGADTVLVSRDATPFGRRRDRAVAARLEEAGAALRARPGLLVQEPESVARPDGGRYAVFTPFLRRWEALPLRTLLPASDPFAPLPDALAGSGPSAIDEVPDAAALGVSPPTADVDRLLVPGESAARGRLNRWLGAGPGGGAEAYDRSRDRLADADATSRLGADLRFGLLSPVEVATRTLALDPTSKGVRRFVSELAWRDFYAHVLWHEPRLAGEPFQVRYGGMPWPGGTLGDASEAVEAWCGGRTGYPIVDAPMRELLATGFMPNRARMIVASFLTKDLLVDWRVGEAHFMRHLVDGDPASNLGGWQWAASVGTDAQPYFRIFNPVTQGRRFDADGAYVRTWLPELARVPDARVHAPWTMTAAEQEASGCRIGTDYPAPIVDHAEARARALAWFASARDDASD